MRMLGAEGDQNDRKNRSAVLMLRQSSQPVLTSSPGFGFLVVGGLTHACRC